MGPQEAADNLAELLGSFMIRKVAASQDLLSSERPAPSPSRCPSGFTSRDGPTTTPWRWPFRQRWRRSPRPRQGRPARWSAWRHGPAGAPGRPSRFRGRRGLGGGLPPGPASGLGALWFKGGVGPLSVPTQVSPLAEESWCGQRSARPSASRVAPDRGRQRLPVTAVVGVPAMAARQQYGSPTPAGS